MRMLNRTLKSIELINGNSVRRRKRTQYFIETNQIDYFHSMKDEIEDAESYQKGLNIAFSARILQAAASAWIVEDLETLRPPLKMQRKNICRFWLQRI